MGRRVARMRICGKYIRNIGLKTLGCRSRGGLRRKWGDEIEGWCSMRFESAQCIVESN